MKKQDEYLRELFTAARRADRAEAPGFRSLLRRERPVVRRPVFRYAALATAATITVAVAASWIYLRAPEHVLMAKSALVDEKSVVEKPAAQLVVRAAPPEPPVVDEVAAPVEPAKEALDKYKEALGMYSELKEQNEPSALSQFVERVRVVTETDVVDLEKTDSLSRFSDQVIQDMPEPGRFYRNVITLAPKEQNARSDFKTEVAGVKNVTPLTGNYMEEERLDEFNTESYDVITENDFLTALDNPLSTFSIDVDTASYSNVRRFLTQNKMPPKDAVRIEEMINYFHYDYPPPSGGAPFSASVEIADCPWRPEHRLARIGLKGEEITRDQLAGSNLVFLLDVSGSMAPPNKLPLLKSAFSLLAEQLNGSDRVAIVVYAGASGLVLPSTPGSAKSEILGALDRLSAGGGTNGGSGLELAYRIARENFIAGGVNRVILATDGDFNLGVTGKGALLDLIEKDAHRGVFLTTLGFGMGNYKDAMLETLADKGNGNYAYIDTINEARKVLVDELGSTLITIAKDVKIQVEFNPTYVGAYRLIGYENRMLKKEDFNDDKKDAGEIGAGHTVTALYEIAPPGSEEFVQAVDPLKYQSRPTVARDAQHGELLTLKIRYKEPEGSKSRLLEFPIVDEGLGLEQASEDFKFAAAVAQFGMILRGSEHKGCGTLEDVRALALKGIGSDEYGYRSEFFTLVNRAMSLSQVSR